MRKNQIIISSDEMGLVHFIEMGVGWNVSVSRFSLVVYCCCTCRMFSKSEPENNVKTLSN